MLTKYEALHQLREYYRYTANDENKLRIVTACIMENLNKGYDFPIMPANLYAEYTDLVVPNAMVTSESVEMAFKEYAETCL